MTLAASADHRLARVFHTLDADRDGYLGWADFQRLVARYCDTYGVGPDTLRGQALRVAYEAEWLELRRHAGGAERLTEAGFVAAVRRANTDTSRFDILENVPQAIFDVMDDDGDDAIDEAGFTKFLEVWQIPPATGLAAFTAMDADQDGVISRREFIDSVRQFHDDGDEPGSRYFGRS
jgi:Ca2+-binding EF-hand superfamily protein